MDEKVKKEENQEPVQEGLKEEAKEESEFEKPIDKMTAKELREIAVKIPGVTGVHAMKKEELLKIIKEAKGIKDEPPVKMRKKKGAKPGVSVKALKQKITELRKEKEAIRMAKDRKKVDILRRRINRLKKRARKAAHA